jgi:hypothetical protein
LAALIRNGLQQVPRNPAAQLFAEAERAPEPLDQGPSALLSK